MNNYFRNSRLKALHHWLHSSGREILYQDGESIPREYIANNFECKWQLKNEDIHRDTDKENNHVSIFCSLSSWSSHITDLLSDVRFDQTSLSDQPIKDKVVNSKGEIVEIDIYEDELLFRHYSRFFLVVSELLVDFADIAKFVDSSNKSKIFENNSLISYEKLRGYINNVFKHKTHNLHKCNHHIPFIFSDGNIHGLDYKHDKDTYYIEVGCSHNYGLKNIEYIIVIPKLIEVIRLIIHCYNVVDNLLTGEKIKYIAGEYGDKY
ncbi:hypothetical protein CLV84_4343 [Neolewinella xylanilytica]|uniref:Uncharacterized protein n=1 Tax=Neolewinella xylanilytica TaxID=1514080 RepID=A0A2S6HZN2_9BACT|nr:hypothetical protein [Neolewinella xylanilytica]PPK83797.1 hypothetical protein CLV84_4343 [Neolewinella xylanilytica]